MTDGRVEQIDDILNMEGSTKSFYNGTFRETFDARLTSNGTAITLSLEQSGGGDLVMQFSDGETTLNCVPAQTINLTPGTDESPQGTFVYIPQNTKVLTTNTTAWPSDEHIKVAYILVPSAAFVQDHGGSYINQNWNDHLAGADEQGHLTHVCARVRSLGASWYSGVSSAGIDDYFDIGVGTVYWKSNEGVVQQMHPQNFPAQDTSGTDVMVVKNDPDQAYTHIQNLYTGITDDSTGNSIPNNRYFSLVFWGVINKSGEYSGVFCNLPSGSYTTVGDALIDSLSYDDYSFPREFDIDSGTAFLIARSIFRMGSTAWTYVQTEDLRGLSPARPAGGVGTNDHGSLGGLGDDDHTQYVLVDGSRAFSGNVTLPSLSMTGHILAYAGSPSNNQVLTWVTANNRAEFAASGVVTDHGALTGLEDDDHTQYVLVDGSRAMTGNLTVPSIETTASQNMVITHSSTNIFVVDTGNNLNFGTSYAASAIIGGENQTINATHSVILGGNTNNIRDGVIESTIIGGTGHVIRTQDKQAIIGGRDSTANGFCSVMAGGRANGTRGSYSGAFTGWGNTVNGEGAVSVGGKDQTCCGTYSAVISSLTGNVQGNYAATVAGQSNYIWSSTNNSSIVGGYSNEVKANDSSIISSVNSETAIVSQQSAIVGGTDILLTGPNAAVCGGIGITCAGASTFSGGGIDNTINGTAAAIISGNTNNCQSDYSVIIGGRNSTISSGSENSAIVGASLSTINNSLYGAIIGTFNSETENNASAIIGGFHHRSDGVSTAIVGGQSHTIENHYSFIGGGLSNTSNGGSSAMCGGQGNDLTGPYAAVISGNGNTLNGSYAAMVGGHDNECTGTAASIVGGDTNNVAADYAVIAGGKSNQVTADYATCHGLEAVNHVWGAHVQSGGAQAVDGDSQLYRIHMSGSTANGGSTDLTLDGIANSEKLVQPASTTWYFRARVSAMNLGKTSSAAYRVFAATRRGATGNSALIGNGALTNPSFFEDFVDTAANWNIAFAIRTGSVITINCTHTGNAYWSALVDIVQVGT
jgi:hypothetical protein